MESTLIFFLNHKLDGGNFQIVPQPKLITMGNKSMKKEPAHVNHLLNNFILHSIDYSHVSYDR